MKIKDLSDKKRKLLLLFIAIGILLICILSIFYFKKVMPKNTYSKALTLLDEGNYQDAKTLFDKIPEYKNVSEIQTEILYETYVFEGLAHLKKYLKNPDTLKINDIIFYSEPKSSLSKEGKKILSKIIKNSDGYPVIIMDTMSQNGFGGNGRTFIYFLYDKRSHRYVYVDSARTLNKDKATKDELSACIAISTISKNFKTIGKVNLDRINKILKDNTYTNVKIME